jgi:signal transduction histidine kinase
MAESLIAQAGKDVSSQNFDAAMEKALMALEQSEGQPRIKVQALQTIVGIDIMTSRDADAWGKALEAETIARKHGLDKELAGILISKAKLCSYAEISPETGRNDEGLEYANEALRIAETIKEPELEAEACFVIGSLYINKNRWSDPIDQGIYRTAGEWLDRGQAVADANGIERLRRNGVLFRSRWFQQGGRNEEALEYFANARKNLPEDDHLMASALDDRLVRLYTRTGDSQSALDAHDDYVREITRYMNQKSDETLQEMETRFEVKEKEYQLVKRGYQITILLMLVMLAAAIIVIAVNHIRRVRRRNDELLRINATKEQLIEILSKDLRNPAQAYRSDLEKLSEEAATLDSEQIRERCRKIAESAQSINQDVANYVGDILIERGRKIADIGLSQREIQIIR